MRKNTLPNINDVQLITIQSLSDGRGSMTVVSETMIPFVIKRVFSITSNSSVRGNHAHRNCNQFIACLTGSLTVFVTDGKNEETYTIDHSSQGLLIPPGIWSSQRYDENLTTINVYCDLDYDEADYLRDYYEYIKYRSQFEIE